MDNTSSTDLELAATAMNGENGEHICPRDVIRSLRQRTLERKHLIQTIRQFVQESLPSAPTLEQMANHFCLSSRTLSRRLREAEINYRKITTEIRMYEAQQQLGNTSTPIRKIAESMGYQNNSNFTKAFRSWTGSTPHQYRTMASMKNAARSSIYE